MLTKKQNKQKQKNARTLVWLCRDRTLLFVNSGITYHIMSHCERFTCYTSQCHRFTYCTSHSVTDSLIAHVTVSQIHLLNKSQCDKFTYCTRHSFTDSLTAYVTVPTSQCHRFTYWSHSATDSLTAQVTVWQIHLLYTHVTVSQIHLLQKSQCGRFTYCTRHTVTDLRTAHVIVPQIQLLPKSQCHRFTYERHSVTDSFRVQVKVWQSSVLRKI